MAASLLTALSALQEWRAARIHTTAECDNALNKIQEQLVHGSDLKELEEVVSETRGRLNYSRNIVSSLLCGRLLVVEPLAYAESMHHVLNVLSSASVGDDVVIRPGVLSTPLYVSRSGIQLRGGGGSSSRFYSSSSCEVEESCNTKRAEISISSSSPCLTIAPTVSTLYVADLVLQQTRTPTPSSAVLIQTDPTPESNVEEQHEVVFENCQLKADNSVALSIVCSVSSTNHSNSWRVVLRNCTISAAFAPAIRIRTASALTESSRSSSTSFADDDPPTSRSSCDGYSNTSSVFVVVVLDHCKVESDNDCAVLVEGDACIQGNVAVVASNGTVIRSTVAASSRKKGVAICPFMFTSFAGNVLQQQHSDETKKSGVISLDSTCSIEGFTVCIVGVQGTRSKKNCTTTATAGALEDSLISVPVDSAVRQMSIPLVQIL